MHKNNHYIINKSTEDSDKLLFDIIPNIIYKETIINNFNHSYWICDSFDIYYPIKENKLEPYLIYVPLYEKEINILKIRDKKIVAKLTGSSNYIEKVKNFYNEKDKHNYLLSSDWDFSVLIWDLDNNYELKHKLAPGYSNYIYSFLICFKFDYVITSTVGHTPGKDHIKIFLFKEGTLLKSILDSDNVDTLYLILWEKEKKEEETYIIALCYEKVSIYNLLSNDLYCELSTNVQESCGDYYFSGFVSYDNKYLYTSSDEGYINIWDLYQKILVKTIKLKDSSLFKIIPWCVYINHYIDKEDSKFYKNINNYILVCDKNKKGIINLNVIFKKEIDYNDCTNKINDISEEEFYSYQINSFNKSKDNQAIKSIKKIIHPIYGNSILCSDENNCINLWTNTPPIIIDIFKKEK